MKIATMLDLGGGKIKEIELMGMLRSGEQVLIAFYDDREMSRIAADFENVATMSKQSSVQPSVKEVYEGFTQLASLQRNEPGGMVRVILAKP